MDLGELKKRGTSVPADEKERFITCGISSVCQILKGNLNGCVSKDWYSNVLFIIDNNERPFLFRVLCIALYFSRVLRFSAIVKRTYQNNTRCKILLKNKIDR